MGLSKKNPRGNFNWQSRYIKKKAINCGELNEPVGPVVAPVADFSGTPTTVTEGDTVNFTDLSTNTPTAWSWSFPGGTPATDTLQNPSIVYNTAGTYNVDLTASNGGGSGFVSKPNYITVIPPPPVADFSASSTNIYAGDTVNFTDLSTNTPTAWSWVFAGGTPATSATQNPSVVYNTVGTYGVDLTATNAGGSDPESKPNYITVNYPYLLDLNPGAAAAYSVRRLSSTYTGAAIRVRRSSDNTEQDIGFSGVNLDTTALSSFVGAASGFVTKWYDQSGNNNDSFNTVGGTQPRLVNGGVIEVQNSKPSVRFLAAFGQELVLTNTLNINTSWSCYSVLRRASTSDSIASICNNTTAGYIILLTSNLNYVWYTNTVRQSTNTLTNLNLYSVYNNNTNIYINNVVTATSLTLTLAGNNFNRIGRRGNTNPEGYISEIIFYPTSQLSNNTGINTNITTYYSI